VKLSYQIMSYRVCVSESRIGGAESKAWRRRRDETCPNQTG